MYIDGIPLDLAAALLPLRSRLNPGLAAHIHLHAAAQKRYAGADGKPAQVRGGGMSKQAFTGLIESLQNTVRGLQWQPQGTEWGDYYDSTNYTRAAFDEKLAAVTRWAAQVSPAVTWDLGANTGVFSRARRPAQRIDRRLGHRSRRG